jgi:gluconolactonase
MDLTYDGRVYRVDVETGKVKKLDTGIKFTNGSAFGPDRLLYANEALTGNISTNGKAARSPAPASCLEM